MSPRLRTREWSGVDYYADLGITTGASRVEIDEAYRRRAKELHPDRNAEATAEERFKRVSAAYEVLRDPSTRGAYDDFRFRVDSGQLYTAEPAPAPRPAERAMYEPTPGTYRRPRKARRPLPPKVRLGIGYVLMILGVAAALWALVGPLPSHTAGDTDLAVQITIGIMAAKLLVGGVIVIKYPQLKARWHREPGVPVGAGGRGDRMLLEN